MVTQTAIHGQEDATHSKMKHGKLKSVRTSLNRKKHRKPSPSLKRDDSPNPSQKTGASSAADNKQATLTVPITESAGSNLTNNDRGNKIDHLSMKKKGRVVDNSGADGSSNDASRPHRQRPPNKQRRNKANKWSQKHGSKPSGGEKGTKREYSERSDEVTFGVGCTKGGRGSPSHQKPKSNYSISKSTKTVSFSQTEISAGRGKGASVVPAGNDKKQNLKNVRVARETAQTVRNRRTPQSPLSHGGIACKDSLESDHTTSSPHNKQDDFHKKCQDTEERHQYNARPIGHQRRPHYIHHRNNNKLQKGQIHQPHRKQHSDQSIFQERDDTNLIEKTPCESGSPTSINPTSDLLSKEDKCGHYSWQSSAADVASKPERDGSFEAENSNIKERRASTKNPSNGENLHSGEMNKHTKESQRASAPRRHIRRYKKAKQKVGRSIERRSNYEAERKGEESNKKRENSRCASEILEISVPHDGDKDLSHHENGHSPQDVTTLSLPSNSVPIVDKKSRQYTSSDHAKLLETDKISQGESLGIRGEEVVIGKLENKMLEARTNADKNGEFYGIQTRDKSLTQNVITTNAAGAAILSRLYRTDCDKENSCAMSSSSSSSLSASCAEAMATIETSAIESSSYSKECEENQPICSDQFQQEVPEHINLDQQHQVAYSNFLNHVFYEENMYGTPVLSPAMFVQVENRTFAGPGPLQYPMFVSGAAISMPASPQYPLPPEAMYYYTQINLSHDGAGYLNYENNYCNGSIAPTNTTVWEGDSSQEEGKKTVWNVNAPVFEPSNKQ